MALKLLNSLPRHLWSLGGRIEVHLQLQNDSISIGNINNTHLHLLFKDVRAVMISEQLHLLQVYFRFLKLVFSLQPLCVSAAPTHTGDYKQEVEKKKTEADKNKEVNLLSDRSC